jgi:hypothetical protein
MSKATITANLTAFGPAVAYQTARDELIAAGYTRQQASKDAANAVAAVWFPKK